MTMPAEAPELAGILAQDHHVHSTYSDDATSTIAENIAAASVRGLHTLCLTEHVRSTTSWLPEFTRAVAAAGEENSGEAAGPLALWILAGVEAKMVDSAGHLDLPADLPTLDALDRVLIADHQYPDVDGPVGPSEVRRRLDSGQLTTDEVVETLVVATAQAMRRAPHPQLAHLFSLLPKVGLDETDVGVDQLRLLAATAKDTGAVVEANEKWGCPGPAALAGFRSAGVTIVASTDSHRADDIGDYRRVVTLLAGDGSDAR